MDKCLVYGCPNSLTSSDLSSVQLHYFPKHPVLAQQWLNCCCVWNPGEVDLNTARICSIHFDDNSYTYAYKMVDCVGYARVIKHDAFPTLYLPQQTIVYRVEEGVSTVVENNVYEEQHIENLDLKYEELQAVPLQGDSGNPVIEEKCETVMSYKELEEVKAKNEMMKKELLKLEQSVDGLNKKLTNKIDECKAKNAECNKLGKILSSLEIKVMSFNEQKNLLSKVFSESQIKILSGRKKIYWSDDDMAVGYTIRHMSNKRCYGYLSKKLNIPLPGLSSIKRWQCLKKTRLMKEENAGESKTKRNSDVT